MDRLTQIFAFNEQLPMVFTRVDFWIFFLVVYAGFALISNKISLRNAYLMVVSLFFYFKTGGLFVVLLIFSIVSTYYLARWIHRSTSVVRRKGAAGRGFEPTVISVDLF
jgi:alginate O-acetyltransferase complex protein AlgI